MIPFVAGFIVGAFAVIATLFLWLTHQGVDLGGSADAYLKPTPRLNRINDDNQDNAMRASREG